METITSIRVVVNESDLANFLAETSNVRQAMQEYVGAYTKLIQREYPGAEVKVEAGPTNGGDWIWVDGQRFGIGDHYTLDDLGGFGGAPKTIHQLAEELVQDWSWLTVATIAESSKARVYIHTLRVRLTEHEWQVLKARALVLGQSMSEFVRRRVFDKR